MNHSSHLTSAEVPDEESQSLQAHLFLRIEGRIRLAQETEATTASHVFTEHTTKERNVPQVSICCSSCF